MSKKCTKCNKVKSEEEFKRKLKSGVSSKRISKVCNVCESSRKSKKCRTCGKNKDLDAFRRKNKSGELSKRVMTECTACATKAPPKKLGGRPRKATKAKSKSTKRKTLKKDQTKKATTVRVRVTKRKSKPVAPRASPKKKAPKTNTKKTKDVFDALAFIPPKKKSKAVKKDSSPPPVQFALPVPFHAPKKTKEERQKAVDDFWEQPSSDAISTISKARKNSKSHSISHDKNITLLETQSVLRTTPFSAGMNDMMDELLVTHQQTPFPLQEAERLFDLVFKRNALDQEDAFIRGLHKPPAVQGEYPLGQSFVSDIKTALEQPIPELNKIVRRIEDNWFKDIYPITYYGDQLSMSELVEDIHDWADDHPGRRRDVNAISKKLRKLIQNVVSNMDDPLKIKGPNPGVPMPPLQRVDSNELEEKATEIDKEDLTPDAPKKFIRKPPSHRLMKPIKSEPVEYDPPKRILIDDKRTISFSVTRDQPLDSLYKPGIYKYEDHVVKNTSQLPSEAFVKFSEK